MVDKSRSAEISRLTDLLQSNPGSRLFVPLAEAYLKSDMLEEATQVLSDGLKTHSSFVAARVMLGKIYLKTQDPKAKEQFEQVIAIAPSNIPSLKGLAGIYKKEGALAEAKIAYQTILKIDPGDKEAVSAIECLENTSENTIAQAFPKMEETAEGTRDKTPLSPKEMDSESLENEDSSGNVIASQETPDTIQSGAPETNTAPLMEKSTDKPVPEKEEEKAATDNKIELPMALEPHENRTMAALYMSQGHFQEAAKVYERLLKQDPRNKENQDGLEEALVHLRKNEKTPLSKTEKIERLQLWLEAIQGEKKR